MKRRPTRSVLSNYRRDSATTSSNNVLNDANNNLPPTSTTTTTTINSSSNNINNTNNNNNVTSASSTTSSNDSVSNTYHPPPPTTNHQPNVRPRPLEEFDVYSSHSATSAMNDESDPEEGCDTIDDISVTSTTNNNYNTTTYYPNTAIPTAVKQQQHQLIPPSMNNHYYSSYNYDSASEAHVASTTADTYTSTSMFSSFLGSRKRRTMAGTNTADTTTPTNNKSLTVPLAVSPTTTPASIKEKNSIYIQSSSTSFDNETSVNKNKPSYYQRLSNYVFKNRFLSNNYNYDNKKEPRTNRNRKGGSSTGDYVLSYEQKMLFYKIIGMLVIITFALSYTRSVHVDHLQEIQYNAYKKQQLIANNNNTISSHSKSISITNNNNNYEQQQQYNSQQQPPPRLLRTVPYYHPSLFVPTETMKQQFLQYQRLLHTSTTTTTTTNTDSTSGTASTEYPLLHIIKTRFMQEQGQLLSLGEARLALFAIFCLPTIVGQSTQNFIWLIKVDPNLNPMLLQQLIDLVLGTTTSSSSSTSTTSNEQITTPFRGNIYIIGSNINYRVNIHPDSDNVTTIGGWRNGIEPMELATVSKVYTGNQTLLEWYMSLESQLVLLETRLDADDGLHVGFIHTVQQKAYEQFIVGSSSSADDHQQQHVKPKWMYWCSRRHLEWHWTDPEYNFVSPRLLSSDTNHINNNKNNNIDNNNDDTLSTMIATYGAIQGIQHKELCITPGITTGYNIGTREETVPVYSHDVLYKRIATQMEYYNHPKNNCYGTNTSDTTTNNNNNKNYNKNCIQFIETFVFEAIRSRCPTSAGMLRIEPNYKELYEQHTWWITYIFWNMLHDSFGLHRLSLSYINQYLSNNLIYIVHDNIIGQCTVGHSCKDKAKNELQQLLQHAKQRNQQQQQQQQKQQLNQSLSSSYLRSDK